MLLRVWSIANFGGRCCTTERHNFYRDPGIFDVLAGQEPRHPGPQLKASPSTYSNAVDISEPSRVMTPPCLRPTRPLGKRSEAAYYHAAPSSDMAARCSHRPSPSSRPVRSTRRSMTEDRNDTIGALLVATLITAVGYGVTSMQTYQWYRAFPQDPPIIRWVVMSVCVLDTLHIILIMHMIYYYLVTNYDNPSALAESVWSWDVSVLVTALITCVVHGFYARRVYILGHRRWPLVIVIGVLSTVRLVFGCIVTIRMLIIRTFAGLPHQIAALVGTGMGAGTLADWIITLSLVILLRRKKTKFSQTDSLIDKLTYWTINNGLLTSVVGLAVIFTFVTMPYNMIYMALHPLLSKLYANSLLATLNFRSIHRDEASRDVDAGNDALKLQVGMGHVRSRSATVCSCRPGSDPESSPTDTKVESGKGDTEEMKTGSKETRTTVTPVHADSYEGKVTAGP
ncbi:uncharacterized protein C8Q71DRAFT_854751 [Rhodofomes roseus]|uniref:DUF6534 domain-containing protein n=1 Tax=Rhodofomes roseus TaxID=34475 RepID=A0ABQ8KR76_9APHY|nr:uncharacterized protein C8Q71DRAFT_854751 [Rhodofomes roseus]KAH9840897.1 hypothetical protein C8Q71DRAFT_854751 [Rhodofomes roseus]